MSTTLFRPVAGGVHPCDSCQQWQRLSPRERDVALLVSEARGNAEIGRLLYIAVNTVGYHVKQIYMKLDINSRVALTRVVLTRCPGNACHAPRS